MTILRSGIILLFFTGLLYCIPVYAQIGTRDGGYKNWNNDPLSQSGNGFDNSLGFPDSDSDYEEDIPKKKNKPLEPMYLVHSPVKASVYSAALPGLGQIYNKKWWKLPLVYGAIGGCGYAFVWNADRYDKYRKGYVSYFDDDPTTNYHLSLGLLGINKDSGEVTNPGLVERQLVYYKDTYRRYRDMMFMITLGAYVLNIVDAAVDAHLKTFSVSEDITMQIKPQLYPSITDMNIIPIYGFSIGLSF